MPLRSLTGEKGIGRLAIGLLGRQVLVLTRAKREDGLHDLVVALIHWGLFELPGVNLEEIEIPMMSVSAGLLPDSTQLGALRASLSTCTQKLASKHAGDELEKIIREIDQFAPDPRAMSEFFESRGIDPLSLQGDGTGTHFLIGPANPVIRLEMATDESSNDYSFRRQILGFCDKIFGDDRSDIIETAFRHWPPGAAVGNNLLEAETFFTRKELDEGTDHFLRGTVDSYGQFAGTLRVYARTYENVIIPWSGNRGRETECGPFTIAFGYLMGNRSESQVDSEAFSALNAKLNNLGGIYVYRDRIRILPYGDYANDWLEVEKRRNKGAGYYFFSFRRMFGAVILTREDNGTLQEKAGREGFQLNEAYRNLRDILMNLLVQLAAEFFRKGGANTELFEQTQREVRRRSEALERQQKRATTKRRNFQNALALFGHEVGAGLPEAAVANLRKLTHSRMEAASKIPDQDKAAAALIRAEQEAVTSLHALRSAYVRRRPSGIALTRELARDWEGYQVEKTRLDTEVFGPFEKEISATLGRVAKQARLYVDQRKRLEERIKSLAEERKRELAEASKQVNATAADTTRTVFSITEKAREALDQAIRNIQVDLNRTDLATLEPDVIDKMREKWEGELTDIESRHRDALIAARDMLASLAENLRSSDGEEPAQIMEALEQRMLALEEQADDDFEMVQLGLAVAIINHEFAASIKRVRESVQELGRISRKTGSLRPLYESIRTNFEHLDGHLNLFTPLQRRLHRTSQVIGGASIRNYVRDLFSNRLERHKILLETTEAFLSSEVRCFPSTLYPAFINLVDNALFWLGSVNGARKILLDAQAGSLLIANNGPAIEGRDLEHIFERGFSRRPSGRGLGLFISAKALKAESMTLSVQPPPPGYNVTFQISVPTLTLSK
jgi:signal transduction histidine kinase